MRLLFVGVLAFAAGFATAWSTIGPSPSEEVVAAIEAPTDTERQRQLEEERIAGNARSYGRERFPVDGRGHVVTVADIDGRAMDVLVDTGASVIALRESDARRAGYRLRESDFTVAMSTANGTTYAAPIMLRSVEIGSIRVRNVPAVVGRDDTLSRNLLGMTFLSRLHGFRFKDGELILEN
ncbi:MAG: TIGR02281 family clan AA aspartic protease [Pseudomonadota bacterium]